MEVNPPLTLGVRITPTIKSPLRHIALPHELHCDSEHHTAGVPWLRGEFAAIPAEQLRITVRVHNHAGIPVIEGHNIVEPGQRTFIFSELRPHGIDAYAHVSEAEREQVSRRVWSRRAYATIEIQPLSS